MVEGNAKGRKEINRAVSMADAAPMLSTTPRAGLGSAFEEGESFDSRSNTARGGASSSARKTVAG